MNKNNNRHSLNLIKLEYAARKLGKLRDEFVFLGGCATGILITDPLAPDIRATVDVDCIVNVLSLREYHKLEKSLFTIPQLPASRFTIRVVSPTSLARVSWARMRGWRH